MDEPAQGVKNDLKPQPARIMYWDEIDRLWQAADQPSTRDLQRRSTKLNVGNSTFSHTTFANALRRGKLPSWPVVKILVILLGGNDKYVQKLWNAAKTEERASRATDPGDQLVLDPRQVTPRPAAARPVADETTDPITKQEFTSWRTEHDWRTAPPIIKLLDVAVKTGINPTKLLLEVAPDDPTGAVPAVAMVADNDVRQAAEVIAYVAAKNRNNGYEMFIGVAQRRPFTALQLVRILHDLHGFRGTNLLIPALYGCYAACRNASGYRTDPEARQKADVARRSAAADAGYIIVEICRDQEHESLVDTLVNILIKNPSPLPPRWIVNLARDSPVPAPTRPANPVKLPAWMSTVDADVVFYAVCDAIEELLHHPRYSRVGANLLGRITRCSFRIGTAMFAYIVALGAELRRGRTGVSNLRILAEEIPRPAAQLFARCVWESAIEPKQLNNLLCQLQSEHPGVATSLSAGMLKHGTANMSVILGETENSVGTAELLLALFSQQREEVLEILYNWVVQNGYIHIVTGTRHIRTTLAPIGEIVNAMLHEHPEQTIVLLLAVVSRLPTGMQGLNLLDGLDEPLRSRTRDLLRAQAAGRWSALRDFVPS